MLELSLTRLGEALAARHGELTGASVVLLVDVEALGGDLKRICVLGLRIGLRMV